LISIAIVGTADAQKSGDTEPRALDPQASFEILRQQAVQSEKAADSTAHAFEKYIEVLKAEGEQEQGAIKESLEAEHAILDHGMTVFTSNVTFFGWALAVLVAAVGTVLALLGWTTKRDIEEEVRKQLERNTVQAIKDRIASFEREIEEDFSRLKVQFDEELSKMREALVSDQRDRAAQAAQPVSSGQRRLDDKRIIWVDDKPRTTLAVRAELENEGAIVDSVASSEELTAKLSSSSPHYDLIVSDLRRGGDPRAGLEYLQKIKDEPELPPRLIFTSIRGVAKYRTEIEELRANSKGRFLGVVTSGEEFFKTVFKQLQKPRQAA
jgi:CheY-like chemotaxis protein